MENCLQCRKLIREKYRRKGAKKRSGKGVGGKGRNGRI
jgi:hypothetical protein